MNICENGILVLWISNVDGELQSRIFILPYFILAMLSAHSYGRLRKAHTIIQLQRARWGTSWGTSKSTLPLLYYY